MKKEFKVGSIVILKDKETKSFYPTLITGKSGEEKERYTILGYNQLGMILYDVKANGLRANVKKVINSIQDLFEIESEKVRNQIISLMLNLEHDYKNYGLKYNENEIMSYRKNFNLEHNDLKSLIENLNNDKIEDEFIKLGLSKFYEEEDRIKMFEKYYRNDKVGAYRIFMTIKNKEYVEENIKRIMNDFIDSKNNEAICSISNNYLIFDTEFKTIDYLFDNIENLSNDEKSYLLSILSYKEKYLEKYRRSFPKKEIQKIFKYSIKHDTDTINFLFKEKLHKYFQIFNILELEEIQEYIQSAAEVNVLLDTKYCPSNVIQFLLDKKKYNLKYEDGSSDKNHLISKIASHVNTPVKVLREMCENTTMTYSADSYGYDILTSALSNPSLGKDFLSDYYNMNFNKREQFNFNTIEQAKLYSILSNPSTDINILRDVKKKFGDVIKFNHESGYNLQIKLDEKIKEREQKGQQTIDLFME